MKHRLLNDKELEIVMDRLAKKYPVNKSMLHFRTPFELLVATILSAQCTDVRVNKVTDDMFRRYSTPKDFNEIPLEELEKEIKTCGLYKNKSKNIKGTAKMILEEFSGEVPRTRKELMKLPGVGRKTANVVLYNAFDIQTIAVDTHVFRVTNRLGIVDGKNVKQTEEQLMDRLPENEWGRDHHIFIHLGRDVCKARNPQCDDCCVDEYCRYFEEEIDGKD